MRFLFYTLILLVNFGQEGTAGTSHTTVSLARPHHKVSFQVEIARAPHELNYGLMNRHSLAKSSGMLFIFPKTQQASFWMKNTLIPLDIIFVQEDGKVVQIHEKAQPLNPDPIHSRTPIKYALELAAGSVQDQNIQLGDRLEQQRQE
jgi:uncharacterized membrane protein (UPF0127 family)